MFGVEGGESADVNKKVAKQKSAVSASPSARLMCTKSHISEKFTIISSSTSVVLSNNIICVPPSSPAKSAAVYAAAAARGSADDNDQAFHSHRGRCPSISRCTTQTQKSYPGCCIANLLNLKQICETICCL